jgi:hypothetical protein
MNNHLPSREPNRIVKKIASANLSIDEIRVMAKIVERLRPDQKLKPYKEIKTGKSGLIEFTIKFSELIPEGHKNYTRIKIALDSLRDRRPDFSPDLKPLTDGWITRAVPDEENGEVEIMIGKELVPDYIALGDGYTEYLTNTVFNLNSKYAIHIYKLLAKNKDKEYFNLYFNYLREFLGIDDTMYATAKDFKRRVIQAAYDELKEKADIYFEADWKTKVSGNESQIGVIKKGRSITGYRIRIINKNKMPLLESREDKANNFVINYAARVGINKRDTLALTAIRNWCLKYGPDRTIEKLDSVSGYVTKSKKKLEYIQKVLMEEFESKSDI